MVLKYAIHTSGNVVKIASTVKCQVISHDECISLSSDSKTELALR